jgi:hypothetical protein
MARLLFLALNPQPRKDYPMPYLINLIDPADGCQLITHSDLALDIIEAVRLVQLHQAYALSQAWRSAHITVSAMGHTWFYTTTDAISEGRIERDLIEQVFQSDVVQHAMRLIRSRP